jgi:hypothetical protein
VLRRVTLATPYGNPGCVPLSNPTKCRKFGLYGLKQAAREWHSALRSQLNSTGYRAMQADPGTFVLEPQITQVDLLFTYYYICKCKVNVNGPSVLRFTLRLQGLLVALYVITCKYIFGCKPCFLVVECTLLWGHFPEQAPTNRELSRRPHTFLADPTNFLISRDHQWAVPRILHQQRLSLLALAFVRGWADEALEMHRLWV